MLRDDTVKSFLSFCLIYQQIYGKFTNKSHRDLYVLGGVTGENIRVHSSNIYTSPVALYIHIRCVTVRHILVCITYNVY